MFAEINPKCSCLVVVLPSVIDSDERNAEFHLKIHKKMFFKNHPQPNSMLSFHVLLTNSFLLQLKDRTGAPELSYVVHTSYHPVKIKTLT